MSGIHGYYQGEAGTVKEIWWFAYEERLVYVIFLEGNPHRRFVEDYGSDIGIEPSVKIEDKVIYVRMNPYAGIWIQENRIKQEDIQSGEKAVIEWRRKYMDEYNQIVNDQPDRVMEWIEELYEETKIPVYHVDSNLAFGAQVGPDLEKNSEIPEPSFQVFISFSSKNIMFARYFKEMIEKEGRAKAWLDRAQGGGTKKHDKETEKFLIKGVKGSKVFVLLLTKQSVASSWVRKEIDWAIEIERDKNKDFHLVLLKLDDVSIPETIKKQNYVIDCKGLSIGEILEELYSAVYERMGRLDWLKKYKIDKEDVKRKRKKGNYKHLLSDSGIAVELQWKKKDDLIYWVLYYKDKKDSKVIKIVTGDDKKHVVDPEIHPGDKIGFYMFSPDTPLWMRSEDLELSPNTVYSKYLEMFNTLNNGKKKSLRQNRYPGEVMWLVGMGIILSSILLLFNYLISEVNKLELPPELTPDQLQLIQSANLALFFMSMFIYGFYSLKYHSHPLQFTARIDNEMIVYKIKALWVITLDTLVKPIIFYFLILIIYGIPVAILLQVLQSFLKIDHLMAFAYGHITIYLFWIIYIGWRLYKLFLEGPDYIRSPSFLAGYTEGVRRNRPKK